jgi:hypothetical protein
MSNIMNAIFGRQGLNVGGDKTVSAISGYGSAIAGAAATALSMGAAAPIGVAGIADAADATATAADTGATTAAAATDTGTTAADAAQTGTTAADAANGASTAGNIVATPVSTSTNIITPASGGAGDLPGTLGPSQRIAQQAFQMGTSIGQNVQSTLSKDKAAEDPLEQYAPPPATGSSSAPIKALPQLNIAGSQAMGIIFPEMSAASSPQMAAAPPQMAAAPPQIAPPPLIITSDKNKKTNIKDAKRTIKDFLNQINKQSRN